MNSRAVFVDDRLRIDAVHFRFRHGAHAAVIDRLAVNLQLAAADTPLRILLDLDFRRVVILDAARLALAGKNVVQYHALR